MKTTSKNSKNRNFDELTAFQLSKIKGGDGPQIGTGKVVNPPPPPPPPKV